MKRSYTKALKMVMIPFIKSIDTKEREVKEHGIRAKYRWH